jgi:hypothetical protein
VGNRKRKFSKFCLTGGRGVSIFGSADGDFGTDSKAIPFMGFFQSFGLGIVGAFVVYFAIYRHYRFLLFCYNPRKEWRVFVFDLLGYLICGGLVTAFLVCPETTKEGFMGGATWQGIVGGYMVGTELKVKKTLGE